MRTIEKTVYKYNELLESAQARAREWYVENVCHDDMPFLSEDMQYRLDELLKQYKIKSDNARPQYSLSYCPGDGATFIGDIKWRAWQAEIGVNGNYVHERSFQIWNAESVKTGKDITDKAYRELHDIIVKIGEELAKHGYNVIESMQEDEYVAEMLTVNEYEFYEDGTRYFG